MRSIILGVLTADSFPVLSVGEASFINFNFGSSMLLGNIEHRPFMHTKTE
jgi:hypothetical protein